MRTLFCNLILLVSPLLFVGCGGGTSGTGIEARALLIQGAALYSDGSPAVGLILVQEETGVETPVDAEGNFGFVIELNSEDAVTLKVRGAAQPDSVRIENIPASSEEVTVTLTLLREQNSIITSDISFFPSETSQRE